MKRETPSRSQGFEEKKMRGASLFAHYGQIVKNPFSIKRFRMFAYRQIERHYAHTTDHAYNERVSRMLDCISYLLELEQEEDDQ